MFLLTLSLVVGDKIYIIDKNTLRTYDDWLLPNTTISLFFRYGGNAYSQV